jgi:hypothetical protein
MTAGTRQYYAGATPWRSTWRLLHASNATATRWTNVKTAAAAYNAPGSFVAFSGWEWNSDTYGHKVAYFLTDDQTMIKPNDPASNHPNEFYPSSAPPTV